MRTAPSSFDYSTLQIVDYNQAVFSVTAISDGASTAYMGNVNFTSSGMGSARFMYVRANNTAGAYLGFNAEL
jgi:hypothetical protein